MTTLEQPVLNRAAYNKEVGAMDLIHSNNSSRERAHLEVSILTLVATMDLWINTV